MASRPWNSHLVPVRRSPQSCPTCARELEGEGAKGSSSGGGRWYRFRAPRCCPSCAGELDGEGANGSS
ncbi:hypothetical protein ABPG75_003585 [Micractinium tetrahymenae]